MVVVAKQHTSLLTGVQDLQQFAIGVIVTDVRARHARCSVQVTQPTDGQQCAEVVLPKHHSFHRLEAAAAVTVEQILLAAWDYHIRGLDDRHTNIHIIHIHSFKIMKLQGLNYDSSFWLSPWFLLPVSDLS